MSVKMRELSKEEKKKVLTAVRNSDVSVLEKFQSSGADVTDIVLSESNITLLHEAAYKGHYDVVSFLLTNGAAVNVVINESKWTPLHWAADSGHTNIVKLLVTNGADMNMKDEWGRTPLRMAVDKERSDIVDYFINEVGMDTSQYDKECQKLITKLLKKEEESSTSQPGTPVVSCKQVFPPGHDDKAASEDGYVQIYPGYSALNEVIANLQKEFDKKLANISEKTERLIENNAHLQDQLTLTQQQLLGIQSMVIASRLWIVSHNEIVIGREIGRGAWAIVHETKFRGTKVAAKCLHNIITSPKTEELFQREMETALVCQHPNIVTFLGATLEGPPVILMELMDTNLRDAYTDDRVKHNHTAPIFRGIANALHFLHTRPDPVVHRDVSSANVLLRVLYNGDWLAKLGDLGTAKIQQQAATPGPGAITYAAPEVAVPNRHSPKMDVYSFGVVVIEVLTRSHPFQQVDMLKTLVKQRHPQYYKLVTSCTKQLPHDRPTMHEVVNMLKH